MNNNPNNRHNNTSQNRPTQNEDVNRVKEASAAPEAQKSTAQGVNARRRNKKGKGSFPLTELFIGLLIITAVFVVIWAVALGSDSKGEKQDKNETEQTLNYGQIGGGDEESSDGTESGTDDSLSVVDPNSYTEITLLNLGDIMCHNPQIDSAYDAATGEYDFTDNYQYIKDIVSKADYSVVNFEVTLSGKDYGYSGYPVFNAPETLLDALIDTGFDMMLFANNHCYDYSHHGLIRTQEMFNEKDVDYIGAKLEPEDKTYKTVDVNGVKLGMLNSTDDLRYGNTEAVTINGIAVQEGDVELIDYFNHGLLDNFYSSVETRIAELKSEGADLIIYYIHWGEEYYITHNDMQGQIAQKLCDLGVDVIIGGHPHVIQDAEMLTSTTDSEHQTLCFYSLGNVVSNQNRLTMGDTMNKEYTENGLMVELTIRKYAGGDCVITGVETIPMWVHRYYNSTTYKNAYDIVPIEAALENPEEFGLYNSNFGVTHATAALQMTNDTLGGICEAFAESVVLPTGNSEN